MSDMRDDDMRTDGMRTSDSRTDDLLTDGMRSDETRSRDTRTDESRTANMRTEQEKMGDERRTANRRQKEAETMRTNPEVMGRAEPVAIDDRDRAATEPRPVGRVGGPGEVRGTNGAMNMWPDMSE